MPTSRPAIDALRASRASRRRVRAEAPLLRRGLYLAVGHGLWRRLGTSVPEHLDRTKGRPAARGGRARLSRLAVDALTPPVLWVAGVGSYTLAATTHDGGAVLLSPVEHRVARRYGQPVGEDRIELRRRFGQHVPTPRFEVVADDLVVEEFVEGRHLLDLDGADRLRAIRVLLRHFTALAEHEAQPGGGELVASALDALDSGAAPEDLRALVASLPVRELAARWPVVPSAAEATVKNLLVTAAGTPVPIDLGDVRLELFFAYPLGLVGEARPDLPAAYRAGALNRELEALFRAAKVAWTFDDRGREVLLAVRLVVAAYLECSSGSSVDPQALTASLQRRWQAWHSSRPPSHR